MRFGVLTRRGRPGRRGTGPPGPAGGRTAARSTSASREVLLVDAGPGHTDHDLAVIVARHARRWSSAATWSRSPASRRPARTRCRTHWPAALDRLLALGGETAVYVPGHGAVVDARFVRAQRDALARRGPAGPDRARLPSRPCAARVTAPTSPRRGSGPRRCPQVAVERDLVVEEVATGFCGAVIALREDRAGPDGDPGGPVRQAPGLPDGCRAASCWTARPVTLVRPAGPGAPAAPGRTASGSLAVPGARARVARAGRIYVEGRHDAELVERVWGDDLRVEGVVVEYLGGRRRPARGGRRRSPPAPTPGSACWSTTWSPAPRSPGSPPRSPARTSWSSATPTSTSGRP